MSDSGEENPMSVDEGDNGDKSDEESMVEEEKRNEEPMTPGGAKARPACRGPAQTYDSTSGKCVRVPLIQRPCPHPGWARNTATGRCRKIAKTARSRRPASNKSKTAAKARRPAAKRPTVAVLVAEVAALRARVNALDGKGTSPMMQSGSVAMTPMAGAATAAAAASNMAYEPATGYDSAPVVEPVVEQSPGLQLLKDFSDSSSSGSDSSASSGSSDSSGSSSSGSSDSSGSSSSGDSSGSGDSSTMTAGGRRHSSQRSRRNASLRSPRRYLAM